MTAEQVIAASSAVSALAIIVLIWQAILSRRQVQVAQAEALATQEQIRLGQEQARAAQEQIRVAQVQARAAQEQIQVAQEQSREQLSEARADHERSRREKAVDLLLEWATNAQESGADARRFWEILSQNQMRKLYHFKDEDEEPEIRIDIKHKSLLTRALYSYPGTKPGFREAGQRLILEKEAALYIRWNFVRYLNLTEAVISAWIHNIADRKMIHEQFKFFYGESGYRLVADVTSATENAWPSMAVFVTQMYRKTAEEREKAAEEYNYKSDMEYGQLFPSIGTASNNSSRS